MKHESLYHHGIKGMKWGIRKNKTSPINDLKVERIISKKSESVELHQNPISSTAKFLAKVIPSIKTKQDYYKDYTIRSKDGKVVGNLSTNEESKESLNIVWLGINNKSSNKGYGQSTMRTILDDAKRSGFKNVTLEVPTISPNAKHIYEKIGFKETGETMLGDENDVWGGLTKMKLDFL